MTEQANPEWRRPQQPGSPEDCTFEDPCPPRARVGSRLRVILIDDSKEFMTAVRRLLARELADVEVSEYDTEQQGEPSSAFDWSLYDVLFIDHDLGTSKTGLDWLSRYRDAPGFPPAIVMAAGGDEYVAARAIKLGASDFIKKQDITAERLAGLVREALSERETTRRNCKLERDAAIVRGLGGPGDRRTPDGRRIGYRFVRLIGQGSTSRVYLAERAGEQASLVLKVIDVATIREPEVLERFVREAALLASLDSPFVVRFHEHGFTEDYGYIAMEFFTRGDLKQRIEHGVSVADAVNYSAHVLRGLTSIHELGIVHRDLKPGNVMFRSDDSLALADFGISKRLDDTSELTRHGGVLGTPNYISPEQALGRLVDHRSDLYSAGVMLYEMLAGRKPFRAENATALVYQHVHAEVPPLPEPVRHFQPVIDIALAKEPAARFASAVEFLQALQSLARARPVRR